MPNSIEEIINPVVEKPPHYDPQSDTPAKAPVEPEIPPKVTLPAKPDTEPPVVITAASIVKDEVNKQDCFYCKAEKLIRFTQGISFVLTLFALIYFLIKQAKNGRGRE
jgi:hypothetical protein